MQVRLKGYSDDIVSVEGDLSDELYPVNPGILYLSSGDQFKVDYDISRDGIWTFEHIVESGNLDVEITPCPDEEPEQFAQDVYSDTVEVSGDFDWIECWEQYPPSREEILDRFVAEDLIDNLTVDQMLVVYRQCMVAKNG